MKKIVSTIFTIIIFNLTSYSQILSENSNEIQFSQIERPYMTISPFINKLLKLDKVGLQKVLNKFWSENEAFPYTESDSLDNDYLYTTLIYRDSTPNKVISFEIFGTYDEYRLGNKKLYHLTNTDFYYRCYKFPKDICFSYRFVITDTISGKIFKTVDKNNPNLIPHGKITNYSYSVFDLNPPETDWNIEKYTSIIDTLRYTDKVVNKERNIYVYTPSGYNENNSETYPVIYLFDAFIYLNRVEVPNILDNLITEGKIEPMIAVFFGTYSNTRKDILPLKYDFMEEFTTEIVPLIRSKYNVSLKKIS
jgi:hypothetical protein